MKQKLVLAFIVISLVSCNNKQSKENIGSTDTINTLLDTLTTTENGSALDSIAEIELDDTYTQNFSYKGINIFEPREYEVSDFSKHILHTMEPLIGLFHTGNKYELRTCKIVKNNIFENECTGSAMMEPTLNVKGNCLFLFKGLETYNKQVLDTVPGNIKVWLNQPKNFKFKNIEYTLRSEGKLISKSGSGKNYFENISNYKLYLTQGNKSQCILEMRYFADTMTEIIFVGDLDGDNKPDFIISSPDHYEATRILLYLSSYAQGDNLVKLVSITFDSLAC